jgi:osmotically-inducible protein OsmY
MLSPNRLLLLAFVTALLSPAFPSDDGPDRFDDRDITIAVETELLLDAAVPAHLIDIETRDGIVTLSGSVDHLLARDRALEMARAVKGVRAVVDRMRVRPEARSDEEIFHDLYGLLEAHPSADAIEIALQVDRGVATLKGRAESWQEKAMSERLAKGVRGVVKVVNEIEVSVPDERSDPEIEADVKSRLAWDALVRESLIGVQVENGTVRLSGTTGSAAEKHRAQKLAWVAGVKAVDDGALEVDWGAYVEMRRTGEVVPWLTLSDARMKEAVADAFRVDPRIAPSLERIEITVFDQGQLILTGDVKSLAAKRAAGETARNTVGIRRVFNHLHVRPGFEHRPADRRLAAAVEDALERDPYFTAAGFSVRVINGRVVLRGEVGSPFEKKHASDVVALLSGVIEIDNRIEVAFDPPAKRDAAIRADVRRCLHWNSRIDGEAILVLVEDGVVELRGKVDNPLQYREAVACAWKGGAVRVRTGGLEIGLLEDS